MIKRPLPSKRKRLLPVLAVLVLIVGVVAVLELTNTTHLFHKAKAVSGVIPSDKPTSSSSSDKKSSSKKSSSTSSTNTLTSPSSKSQQGSQLGQASTDFLAPYGTFVSNHRPNLGGSPAPSQEQSTCQTSPGASCQIQFTNNGIVKTLESQTADSNGTTIWNWDVKKAGLTEGTWQINAIASLNGQNKNTKDTLTLEVAP